MSDSLFVGVDLGTTNTTCTVAHRPASAELQLQRLSIRQLTDAPSAGPHAYTDQDLLPSVVCVTPSGQSYTGTYCKIPGTELTAAPGVRVVRSIKLQMGNPAWSIAAGPRTFHPRDVAALVLKTVHASLRRAHPAANFDRVTVTIPASFSSKMRQETLRAAELAGFDPNALQLLDEPVAALFSVWDRERGGFPGLPPKADVLVFDMGGGTLDVSILHIDAAAKEIRVRATSRYNEVAGNDLDLEIAALVLQKVRAAPDYNGFLEYDADDPADAEKRQRIGLGLLEVGETVKHHLSDLINAGDRSGDLDYYVREHEDRRTTLTADLGLDFVGDIAPPSVELPVAEIIECLQPLLTLNRRRGDDRNLFVPIEQALERAGVTLRDLHRVFIVGGAAYFPLVEDVLWGYFRKEPQRLDPFYAVSEGAAVWTYLREQKSWQLRETLHDSVFLKRKGHAFLEVLSRPIDVPLGPTTKQLGADECPYVREGGRTVRLEFFQGATPADPFMTLTHVERLALGKELAAESRLVEVSRALDDNKVFQFGLAFQDAAGGGRVEGKVEFRTASAGGDAPAGELPPGLSLNGERL